MNFQTQKKEPVSILRTLLKIPPVFWALVVALIFLGIVSPPSVQGAHLLDFTRQAAPLIIVAIGQTIVLLVGGIDLSVGTMISFITVVAAQTMMRRPENALPCVLLCLAIGVAIGLVNGFLCAKVRVPAFIATLGMNILLMGIMLLYSNGMPGGGIPDNLRFWATGFIAGVPSAAYVWVFITAIVLVLIKLTPVGRLLYSTGANERAVNLAGLNVVRIKIFAYILCSLLAAIAGLVMSAYIGVGSIASGTDYQMNSLIVAILGGAAFDGGKGSIPGTVFAALFLMVLFSLIAALNLAISVRMMINGVILVFGFLLNTVQYNPSAKKAKTAAD